MSDWKSDLAEAIAARKAAADQEHANGAALKNFFVGTLNPFLAEFTNQVRKNGLHANLETSTETAKLTVGSDERSPLFTITFTGTVSSDGVKVLANQPDQTGHVIFDTQEQPQIDHEAWGAFLVGRIKNAAAKEPKKSIKVH